MSQYKQNQPTSESVMAYPPPPPASTGAPAYVAPPPPGYPLREFPQDAPRVPVETKSRGDGFWRGCCAGLCCCCALETCF
ncbi:Cysteine-rich transmembrane CYSTM domain [Dillenia turbinata]|uniref:Cysteine-rich transmembrane CYSTM domain n=1 Tax=Dillenia turbinata TaxID=194707 RepID=A0AAN8URI3_9MAGN